VGCAFDPVPKDMSQRREQALLEYNLIKNKIQPGDICFRMGSTPLLGGLVDFSKLIGELTESDFSHACIVIALDKTGEPLIADINPYGLERNYFRDWHVKGPTKNLAVKRLKSKYQYLMPQVLSVMDELIEQDVLYDVSFAKISKDSIMISGYCTQMVDYVFRKIGHPLADRIEIQHFPGYNIPAAIGCLIGDIDVDVPSTIAGNDKIGLFSSPVLETVIDLRKKK